MTLKGLDVSQYQGHINWSAVAKAGYSYVFVRATIGATGRDAYFNVDAQGAHNAGLIVFAYGFAYLGTSTPKQEADAIISVAKRYPFIRGLVWDVEGAGVPSSLSRATLTADIKQWDDDVWSAGFVPINYLNLNFLEHRVNVSDLSNEILWQAQYASTPTVVGGWHPTFWQYTSSASVPGISGRVDLDVFYGSALDLQNLLNGGHIVAFSTLQLGSSGAEVKDMQTHLNFILGTHIAEDGNYGPQTVAEVKTFQQIYHLSVDGIAGPNTRSKIAEELKAKEAPQGDASTTAPSAPVKANDPGTGSTAQPTAAEELQVAQKAVQDAIAAAEKASAARIQQLEEDNAKLTSELDAETKSAADYKSKVQGLADQLKSL